MKHCVVAILALGCLCAVPLAGQNARAKAPVSVECNTESGDMVGMRLCTELRDEVAASPRYREFASAVKGHHWGLHVVSETIDNDGLRSTQAVTVTYVSPEGVELYLESMCMITGQSRIKEQAQSILALLDKQASE